MTKDTNNIKNDKDIVRKAITGLLQGQDPSLREERSTVIEDKLLSSNEYKASKTVMTYVSMPTEVNTEHFIIKALQHGKRVVVPYVEPQDQTMIATEINGMECLEKGPLGVRQPKKDSTSIIPLKEIDLIVVPAIAYDKNNLRLGRGKGYYDRFLSKDDLSGVKTVGLAFNFQIVDCLPVVPHDRPVDRVITD